MSGGVLNYKYLVKGYFKAKGSVESEDPDQQELEPIEKTFDTQSSTCLVATQEDEDGYALGDPKTWSTNINGVLYNSPRIAHRNLLYNLQGKWRLSVPPTELWPALTIMQASKEIDKTDGNAKEDAEKSLWQKGLEDFYKGSESILGGLPEPHTLFKKHFRKPLEDKELKELQESKLPEYAYNIELNYKNWYNKLTDKEELDCLVLLQQRSAFLFFNDPLFEQATVTLELIHNLEDSATLEPVNDQLKLIEIPFVGDPFTILSEVLPENSQTPKSFEDGNPTQTYLTTAIGNPNSLKKGIYKITVTLDETSNSPKYKSNPNLPTTFSFLHEMHFSIRNDLGEFEMMMASPETLEDSIISHFPARYANLAKGMQTHNASKVIDGMKNQADVASAVNLPSNWAKKYLFAQDKIGFVNGMAKGDYDAHKDIWKLPGLVFGLMQGSTDDILVNKMTESAKAVFSTIDQYKKVKSYIQNAKLQKDLIANLKAGKYVQSSLQFKRVSGSFAKNVQNFFNDRATVHFAQDLIGELNAASKLQRAGRSLEFSDDVLLLLFRDGPAKFDDWLFDEYIKTRQTANLTKSFKAKWLGRGTVAVDIALSAYSLYSSGHAIIEASSKLSQNAVLLKDKFKAHVKHGQALPFPQLGPELEKNLSLTIAAERGVDATHLAAINASIDLTLGVLSCIPVVNAVAFPLMLIKSTGQLIVDNASTITEMSLLASRKLGLDMFPDYSDFKDRLEISDNHRQYEDVLDEILGKIKTDSDVSSNKVLEEDMVQVTMAFLARGMAIAGFVQLINRICRDISSDSPSDFESQFHSKAQEDKWDLEGYIDNVLFNDSWAKMDQDAPFTLIEEDSMLKQAALAYLMSSPLGIMAGAGMYTMWKNNRQDLKRNRNKISNLNTQGAKSKIKSFNTFFPIHGVAQGADPKQIAKTAYYFTNSAKKYEREGSILSVYILRKKWIPSEKSDKWADLTWEKDWSIIQKDDLDYEDKDTFLHALDKITIIVRFKKGKEFENNFVPLKFQTVRINRWPDIKGPSDDRLAEKLETALPKGMRKLFSEDYLQSYGAMYQPTYHVGKYLFNGIKPMISGVDNWCNSGFMKDIGNFNYKEDIDTMKYQISLMIGSNEPFMLRFRPAGSKSTDGFDELPVTAVTPNAKKKITKYEDKLLIPDFLQGTSKKQYYPQHFKDMDLVGFLYKSEAGPKGKWIEVQTANLGDQIDFTQASDWNKYSEIIALFQLPNNIQKKVVQEFDNMDSREWKKTPVKLTLWEDGFALGSNTDGPTYKSSLHYLGILDTATGKLNGKDDFDAFKKELDLNLTPLFKKGSNQTTDKWKDCVLNVSLKGNVYVPPELTFAEVTKKILLGPGGEIRNIKYKELPDKALYAAHFSLNYVSPITKRHQKGLRPFGRYDSMSNMEIQFKFHSDTGLNQTPSYQIEASDEFDNNFSTKYPWRLDTNGNITKTVSESKEKSWMVDYPTYTDKNIP